MVEIKIMCRLRQKERMLMNDIQEIVFIDQIIIVNAAGNDAFKDRKKAQPEPRK
ncbi:MAG: hypothetical protein NVSMB24_34080 [Mucilaginibacter sp.]